MIYSITTATQKIANLTKKIRIVQGGCLAKGTKILMFDLTYKKVEDITVGDKLMGPDSKPRNVLSLARGKSMMYKVHQKKGLPYTVNNEHLLVLEDQGKDIRGYENGKRIYTGRKQVKGYHIRKAEDFYNGSWKSTIRQYKGIKASLSAFPHKEVLLDPYYLGLWLGDGCSRTAAITNIDKEVIDYLYEEIPRLYDVLVQKLDKVTTKITKGKTTGRCNEIVQHLKKYNLLLNKHIPIEYIRNDRKTRLAVLAGLIDSDGCLAKDSKTKISKGYYIVQKRKQLAEDILLLCRSLGMYTTFIPRIAKMKREDGTIYKCEVYVVAIFPKDYTEIPVKIERKKCKMINPKNVLRSSIELEKLKKDNYYGFELDGDHLFLLEDFTITHNTSASKTISILLYLITLAQSDKIPTLTSVISESIPHLKRGAIRDFKNIMQGHGYWDDSRWNATDSIYKFETNSELEFFSADNSDKLRGGRRDRLFINEANNVSMDAFDQTEVRTKEFVFCDYNPTNEFWLLTEVKGVRTDVDFVILTYKDNEALSQNIIDSIEQRRNRKGWWQVYGMGLLGEVEGKIYKDWKIIDSIPHDAHLEGYGVDFGFSNDPTAIIAVYKHGDGFILDELTFSKGLSNKQIADIINGEENKAVVVADCAEPKSIDEIKNYGVNIYPAQKGKDSVKQGIQLVQEQRISMTKRSVNLINDYRNYMWKIDKDGKILNEPEHTYSNTMDACRYKLTAILTAALSHGVKIIKPNWSSFGRR